MLFRRNRPEERGLCGLSSSFRSLMKWTNQYTKGFLHGFCFCLPCIQDTLSSRAALGLPAAECVARAKVSCIQLSSQWSHLCGKALKQYNNIPSVIKYTICNIMHCIYSIQAFISTFDYISKFMKYYKIKIRETYNYQSTRIQNGIKHGMTQKSSRI